MIFKELQPGTSLEGMEIAALKTTNKAPKYLYLLAGTHGDEVEGVYVLNELLNWIKEDDEISIPMVIIPILNPDGYREGRRVNAHCVDLNRNMPTSDWQKEHKKEKYNPGPSPGSEKENQFLIKLLDKFPPALTISFHSWKPMLNYNGDIKDVADYLGSFNGYPVKDDIGYPIHGSLGTYIPEKFNTGVLTFECPTLDGKNTLEEIWKENEKGLKNLLKSDLIEKYFIRS